MKTTTERKENKTVYKSVSALCNMGLETGSNPVSFHESGEMLYN